MPAGAPPATLGAGTMAGERSMAGTLAGLRVVEIGRGLPVALAGMMLADNGAEVVRVERPDAPAPEARFAGHLVWSRGKARLRVDVATPDGRARLGRLAEGADVLLVATRPTTSAIDNRAQVANRPHSPPTRICPINALEPPPL